MNFEKYPFEKLNELLAGIVPNDKYELSALTIGEPKFETPAFIQDKLKETSASLC
jgi:aspartate/methionine/tyrosine aminotransferase